jgi:RNA polymerase sigma factor (sigma-70 family)
MADSFQTEIVVERRLGQPASSWTTTNDALLVSAARNGEHPAYVELCRRHREMVFHTVLRITRNIDDAEDIVQDSWMRGFTHIGTFDGRSGFSSWITRIAINSALTMIRRRRIRKEYSLDDPFDPGNCRVKEMLEPSRNPEEQCLETERLRLVRQAIKRLPSKLRTAIEIRQFHEGSVSELATLAGVSLSTMKSRLVRARLKLREPLSCVLKGKPTPVPSPLMRGANSTWKRSRRQEKSEKITNANGYSMIGQRAVCESFSDAGGSDGPSIANQDHDA